MATLGIGGYRPLRRDRREQVETLRQPSGDPLPVHAKARLTRLLDRLELVLEQIKGLEKARDAVVAQDDVGSGGEAERMIRKLAGLKGIGPELATLLAWEAFVRPFRHRRALAGDAGLTGAAFASGGRQREQGIEGRPSSPARAERPRCPDGRPRASQRRGSRARTQPWDRRRTAPR